MSDNAFRDVHNHRFTQKITTFVNREINSESQLCQLFDERRLGYQDLLHQGDRASEGESDAVARLRAFDPGLELAEYGSVALSQDAVGKEEAEPGEVSESELI